MRHALYGEHMADDEDGWITRGEQEGCVALEVHCGDTCSQVEQPSGFVGVRRGSTALPSWLRREGRREAVLKSKESRAIIRTAVGLERANTRRVLLLRRSR